MTEPADAPAPQDPPPAGLRAISGRRIEESSGEASIIGVNFFFEYFSAESNCGYITTADRGSQSMWYPRMLLNTSVFPMTWLAPM